MRRRRLLSALSVRFEKHTCRTNTDTGDGLSTSSKTKDVWGLKGLVASLRVVGSGTFLDPNL